MLASCSVLAACSGGDSAPPPPKELLPPTEFDATAEELTAKLGWTPNPDSIKVTGYQLYRNSMKLADLDADETSYVDKTIVPGPTYEYELRAVAGGKQSESASATIHFAEPPLEEARLEGQFALPSKVVSWSGLKKKPRPRTYSWYFRPKCKKGACRVDWRDYDLEAHSVLARNGADYKGKYSGFFNVTCGNAHTPAKVKIRLEVTEAKVEAGVWKATKVEGTVTTNVAPQLGCTASHLKETVQGQSIG